MRSLFVIVSVGSSSSALSIHSLGHRAFCGKLLGARLRNLRGIKFKLQEWQRHLLVRSPLRGWPKRMRSVLLICAFNTARMCRVSTQITGRSASASALNSGVKLRSLSRAPPGSSR